MVVGFYLVFKERFGVKVGFGANFLPGIVANQPKIQQLLTGFFKCI